MQQHKNKPMDTTNNKTMICVEIIHYILCYIHESVLQCPVSILIPAKFQVFNTRRWNESLQTVQPHFDASHLTLLHLSQKIDKLTKVAAPIIIVYKIRLCAYICRIQCSTAITSLVYVEWKTAVNTGINWCDYYFAFCCWQLAIPALTVDYLFG